MKKPSLIWLTGIIPLLFAVFFLSCEKNYITQVPEEHIPEYHMTFSFVRHDESDSNYVLTINARTHEVIDSIGYLEEPFRDIQFIDDGNKALITGNQSVYIADVLSHDTLVFLDRNIGYMGSLIISSNQKYLTHLGTGFGIYLLSDLSFVDSVHNSSLLPIGIDDIKDILYAFKRDTSLIYLIDFSVTPSDTTIVDILNWRSNPDRTVSGFLSPDNSTILINSKEGPDEYHFLEYDTDSLKCRQEIQNQYLFRPIWTTDKISCFGISDGNVVKYNTQTHIYSIIINKNNVYSPDYWVDAYEFKAMYVELTADDRYLHIQTPPRCGGPCVRINGHTLVYDLQTKEFVYRYEWSESGGNLMRINPKDWSN